MRRVSGPGSESDLLIAFGRAIGSSSTRDGQDARGHVHKTITIAPDAQAAIHASRLDVVAHRSPFGPPDGSP